MKINEVMVMDWIQITFFKCTLFIIIAVGLMGFIVGFIWGGGVAREVMEETAVEKGYGEFITRETEEGTEEIFRWKDELSSDEDEYKTEREEDTKQLEGEQTESKSGDTGEEVPDPDILQ